MMRNVHSPFSIKEEIWAQIGMKATMNCYHAKAQWNQDYSSILYHIVFKTDYVRWPITPN